MLKRTTVVRIVLGMLLLTAVALKVGTGSSVSSSQISLFSSPIIISFVTAWEILLGSWLLWGVSCRTAWGVASATFFTFAGYSLYLGLIGQTTCGCFGTVIQPSPWTALGIDVLALGLLAVSWPTRPIDLAAKGQNSRSAMRIGMGITTILVAVTAISVLRYGSAQAAIARLRGERLVVPNTVDFGTVRQGERIEQTVRVVNFTGESVRIIGGSASCTCVTTADLPVTIPPGETTQLRVRFLSPKSGIGMVSQKASFWTDDASQQRVDFLIRCRLTE